MNERGKTPKTETVAEYLARGGKITKVPNGGDAPLNDNYTRPSQRAWKELEKEDLRDGQSPNLRWIGDK